MVIKAQVLVGIARASTAASCWRTRRRPRSARRRRLSSAKRSAASPSSPSWSRRRSPSPGNCTWA
ncbi:MAG: hypothetical protein M0C28_23020 [Candidatus Moduliflexus flocculans]|nr:hypothetical protein [Candidatus Moduliflexus flocculans]